MRCVHYTARQSAATLAVDLFVMVLYVFKKNSQMSIRSSGIKKMVKAPTRFNINGLRAKCQYTKVDGQINHDDKMTELSRFKMKKYNGMALQIKCKRLCIYIPS